VSARGISDSVRWLPFSNRPEDIYSALDVFVLASDNEGLPLSLCEAMACERLAIATDVGGTPDVLCNRQVGRLVRVGVHEDLLAACTWAAGLTPEERARVGADARNHIERRFSLPAQIRTITGAIERFGPGGFVSDAAGPPRSTSTASRATGRNAAGFGA
jgi:glycosyltransferase involved in cell wall biosynthesis